MKKKIIIIKQQQRSDIVSFCYQFLFSVWLDEEIGQLAEKLVNYIL